MQSVQVKPRVSTTDYPLKTKTAIHSALPVPVEPNLYFAGAKKRPASKWDKFKHIALGSLLAGGMVTGVAPKAKAQDFTAVQIAVSAATMNPGDGSTGSASRKDYEYKDQSPILLVIFGIIGTVVTGTLLGEKLLRKKRQKAESTSQKPESPKLETPKP